MKTILNFFLGIALFFTSIFMLLRSINITDFHFMMIHNISTAPILIILFVIFVVYAVAASNAFGWILVVLDVIAMIVSVILGTSFSLTRMTALDLCLMLGMFGVGLGLILRTLFGADSKPTDTKTYERRIDDEFRG